MTLYPTSKPRMNPASMYIYHSIFSIFYQIKVKMSRYLSTLDNKTVLAIIGSLFEYRIDWPCLEQGRSILYKTQDGLQKFAFGASQIKLAPYIRQTSPLLQTTHPPHTRGNGSCVGFGRN